MAKKTFEEALQRLEEITDALEEGNLSLEQSLKIFDEGMKLAEYCNGKLEEAQKKVDLLVKKGGTYKTVPFEDSDSADE